MRREPIDIDLDQFGTPVKAKKFVIRWDPSVAIAKVFLNKYLWVNPSVLILRTPSGVVRFQPMLHGSFGALPIECFRIGDNHVAARAMIGFQDKLRWKRYYLRLAKVSASPVDRR